MRFQKKNNNFELLNNFMMGALAMRARGAFQFREDEIP
jgi:hypothetical protein